MFLTFVDLDDQQNCLNGTVIRDNERLFQLLENFRNRVPFFCELLGENGFSLLVGIGDMGCAQFSRRDGNPPYLMAVAKDTAPAKDYRDFLTAGTPTPVSGRYCMPFAFVREIAGHFLKTGSPSPAYTWEEI